MTEYNPENERVKKQYEDALLGGCPFKAPGSSGAPFLTREAPEQC